MYLELFESFNSLLLLQASVDADGREVAVLEQLVELLGAGHLGHEDHHLVELERVQQVVELAVLLALR